jgi:hypothetical protein
MSTYIYTVIRKTKVSVVCDANHIHYLKMEEKKINSEMKFDDASGFGLLHMHHLQKPS